MGLNPLLPVQGTSRAWGPPSWCALSCWIVALGLEVMTGWQVFKTPRLLPVVSNQNTTTSRML